MIAERLWRTVKYEDVYLRGYETATELYHGLRCFFVNYNGRRPHQALGYRTPGAVYREAEAEPQAGTEPSNSEGGRGPAILPFRRVHTH